MTNRPPAERRDVQKSRKAIKNAFLKLSMQKDIRKITVKEILELADISRGTFYAHYKDIYDIQEQITAEILDECVEIMSDSAALAQGDSYRQVLEAVKYLFSHKNAIRSFSENGQTPYFVREFRQILKQGIQKILPVGSDEAISALHASCISSCIVDGCLEVILNPVFDEAWSPEKTALEISEFLKKDGRT